jgi:hypothetical protein
LDLSANEITDIEPIARALVKNTVSDSFHLSIHYRKLFFMEQTLRGLDLSYNQIEQSGAKHLANALQNNTVRPILTFRLSII